MTFRMKLFAVVFIFMGMAWSYPSSSDRKISLDECNKCLASNLPNEILTEIFQNLDSFEALDQCSRACEKWESGVVANSKYIYRHFSNHELVNALFHGLPAHLSTSLPSSSTTSHIFDILKSRAITELCFADKYLFTIKAAEYGDIESLERLFDQQEYDRTLLQDPEGTLGRFESNPLFTNIYRAHENTVKWIWEKIVQWETKLMPAHAHLMGRIVFAKVVLNLAAWRAGYDFDATELNLIFADHFIRVAEQGVDLSFFEKYATLALENGLSPDRVWNATAACRSCKGERLQEMVHFYQNNETVLHEKMMEAVEVACARGSFEMVKYLRENTDSFDPILCIRQATEHSNFDLVYQLRQEVPQIDLHLQSSVIPSALASLMGADRNSKALSGLLEFLTKEYNRDIFSALVPASNASYFLNVYSSYVCGNAVGVETVSRLGSLLNPHAQVESATIMKLIDRLQLPTGNPYDIYCRANETTQILEYVLDNNYFTPTQEHLNAALKTGRLDIVKMIYNKGIESGASLEINSHSLLEMLPKTHQDRQMRARSWQSPELLKYVLEKAFGDSLELKTLSDADKEIVREFIHASNIPFSSGSSTVKYDCYYELVKDFI